MIKKLIGLYKGNVATIYTNNIKYRVINSKGEKTEIKRQDFIFIA